MIVQLPLALLWFGLSEACLLLDTLEYGTVRRWGYCINNAQLGEQ